MSHTYAEWLAEQFQWRVDVEIAAEREACAHLAESEPRIWRRDAPAPQQRIAAAIRARSAARCPTCATDDPARGVLVGDDPQTTKACPDPWHPRNAELKVKWGPPVVVTDGSLYPDGRTRISQQHPEPPKVNASTEGNAKQSSTPLGEQKADAPPVEEVVRRDQAPISGPVSSSKPEWKPGDPPRYDDVFFRGVAAMDAADAKPDEVETGPTLNELAETVGVDVDQVAEVLDAARPTVRKLMRERDDAYERGFGDGREAAAKVAEADVAAAERAANPDYGLPEHMLETLGTCAMTGHAIAKAIRALPAPNANNYSATLAPGAASQSRPAASGGRGPVPVDDALYDDDAVASLSCEALTALVVALRGERDELRAKLAELEHQSAARGQYAVDEAARVLSLEAKLAEAERANGVLQRLANDQQRQHAEAEKRAAEAEKHAPGPPRDCECCKERNAIADKLTAAEAACRVKDAALRKIARLMQFEDGSKGTCWSEPRRYVDTALSTPPADALRDVCLRVAVVARQEHTEPGFDTLTDEAIVDQVLAAKPVKEPSDG